MLPSMIFGRSGRTDGDTGLFLLEGSLDSFHLDMREIRRIASKREGYELDTKRVHLQNEINADPVLFLNKTEGYCPTRADFEYLVRDAGKSFHDFNSRGASVFYNIDTREYATRRYLNEVVGLVPTTRAIKAILRTEGCRTKRTMIFGTGIPQSEGGRTWVIDPCGFTRISGARSVFGQAGSYDFDDLTKDQDRLWAVITDAVPLMSGHYQGGPGEPIPRVLSTKVDADEYEKYLKIYLDDTFAGGGGLEKGLRTIKHAHSVWKKSDNGVPTKQEVCFGLDEQIVDIDDNGMW